MTFANRISSSTSCSIWLPETSPPSSSRDLPGHCFQSCNTSFYPAIASIDAFQVSGLNTQAYLCLHADFMRIDVYLNYYSFRHSLHEWADVRYARWAQQSLILRKPCTSVRILYRFVCSMGNDRVQKCFICPDQLASYLRREPRTV